VSPVPDAGAARIAYAGEPGAFAEDAVLAAFGDVDRISLGSFREVFDAVASGAAVAGVVPIENVINGTVRENYDLLLEFDLVIRGEVVVPVSLCLAALPGQRVDEIERVYSTAPVAAPDDLQHGRCGQGHRRPCRARRGRGPLAQGGRPVRTRGHR
jgi:prephenate dehydratase